jgi:hypothetical protein
MGGMNFLLYFCCMRVVTNTSNTGREGIGLAILAIVCILFSILLTGFGLKQLYAELYRKSLSIRTVIATLTAASSLLASLWFGV